MRRIKLLPILGGCACAPTDDGRGRWTKHRDGQARPAQRNRLGRQPRTGEVSVFDAGSGKRLAVRPTGAGAHEVAIAGHQAYVTNEAAGTVSVLSTRTLAAAAPITLGLGPHHAEPSQDGETILVGLVGTNAVAAIDVDTNEVVETYTSSENSAARAHGPYLRDDTIYVAHETGTR